MNTLCKTAKRAAGPTVVCLVLGTLRAFETLSPRKAQSCFALRTIWMTICTSQLGLELKCPSIYSTKS